MATFDQGDVVRVPFPYTDQETRQRRPALVISDGPVGRNRTLLWVSMITSAENAPWPNDVSIRDLRAAGLPVASVVRASKLATIEAAHCERLGSIDQASKHEVLDAIQAQLGSATR